LQSANEKQRLAIVPSWLSRRNFNRIVQHLTPEAWVSLGKPQALPAACDIRTPKISPEAGNQRITCSALLLEPIGRGQVSSQAGEPRL